MKQFFAILFAGFFLALSSCQKTPEQPNQPEQPQAIAVTISPSLTKVSENYFDNGDAIGLSIISPTGKYATNQKLTFNGSVFTGSLNWYTDHTMASTLMAYYPYNAAGISTFSVQTDQSGGLSPSDFVSSIAQNIYPSEKAVNMVFKHQLTRLNISVVNNAGGSYSNLSIGGIVPKAIISENLTAMADGSAAKTSITPFKGSDAGEYYAIIPPQNAALTISATVNGKVLEQTLPTVEYLPGREHNVNVTIENDALTVTVTGSIEGWGGVDDPIVYSKRLIRKLFVKREDLYLQYSISYNSNGRVTEVKGESDGETDTEMKVSYSNNQVQVYIYHPNPNWLNRLTTFTYEGGRIISIHRQPLDNYSSEYTVDCVYDDNGHLSYWSSDGKVTTSFVWLGDDVISGLVDVNPSSYPDLDYLSSV